MKRWTSFLASMALLIVILPRDLAAERPMDCLLDIFFSLMFFGMSLKDKSKDPS